MKRVVTLAAADVYDKTPAVIAIRTPSFSMSVARSSWLHRGADVDRKLAERKL